MLEIRRLEMRLVNETTHFGRGGWPTSSWVGERNVDDPQIARWPTTKSRKRRHRGRIPLASISGTDSPIALDLGA